VNQDLPYSRVQPRPERRVLQLGSPQTSQLVGVPDVDLVRAWIAAGALDD